MKLITDFHIHSHFSAATSSNLTPGHLHYWSRLKGIDILGTGDCVHPGWLAELKEKLTDSGNGLFKLRSEYMLQEDRLLPPELSTNVNFILTAEISSIYKKNGRVRKVHNLCIFPDFSSVERFQARLEKVGNIRADGRPILGLDSYNLLEMLLESGAGTYMIPAHIWTPWFSVLGSRSGFDSIEECFEDLSTTIVALETGLSSDPPMNRLCGMLDRYRLVSNSDAHSSEKLGREANIFDIEPAYDAIYRSLRDDQGFTGTIEFFPEEGKYHHDGHRKCIDNNGNPVHWNPLETLRHGSICPVCGKEVTLGVLYRISQLADRRDPSLYKGRQTHYSITQLQDLLAELYGVKSRTQKITNEYLRLIHELGNEFHILLWADLSDIGQCGGEILAQGIHRLREGRVHIQEGYDGEFGRIRVFLDDELNSLKSGSLFQGVAVSEPPVHNTLDFNIREFQDILTEKNVLIEIPEKEKPAAQVHDRDQLAAINFGEGPCLLTAGPGSGKTRVLTDRIEYLVNNRSIDPNKILAITFSNRAADEIRNRLNDRTGLEGINVRTFHALGHSIITEFSSRLQITGEYIISDDLEIEEIILSTGVKKRDIPAMRRNIEKWKNFNEIENEHLPYIEAYNKTLHQRNFVDFDDLILLPINLLRDNSDIADEIRSRYRWILVDEFQDISHSQYELLKLLAPPSFSNVMGIGDPDQSIYGFRGGSSKYMDQFRSDYAPETIFLGKSYRCPDTIMNAAAHVMRRDSRIHGRENGMRITIIPHATDVAEADWIAETIEKMLGGVRSFSRDSGISDGIADAGISGFSDFAVLCRSSFMFAPIIEAFNNHGIVYQIAGEESLLNIQPYIMAVNHFRKTYSCKSGSGDKISIDDRISGFIADGMPVYDIILAILENDNTDRIDRERLYYATGRYCSNYRKFFQDMALRRAVDDIDRKAEAVSLMTIHSAKGLEFNTIFIPGCEDGILPFTMFGETGPDNMREEERLFYVGVTRTRNNLCLSYASSRRYRGRILNLPVTPFIGRIQKDLIQIKHRKSIKKNQGSGQMELF